MENHQDNPQETVNLEPLEESTDNPQHPSDIVVTQVILCITIVTGIFIINIFKPELSTYIIDTFKHHTTVEFSETIKYTLIWLYDRI